MNQHEIDQIKKHFRIWSGGGSPESDYQITVYLDYAAPSLTDEERIEWEDMFLDWMNADDPDTDIAI
ncbi:hypothetical protein HED60_12230 [Planctomycetales bacterium ZRK34]|nr:hypothetical protein HED60_12230 [Planctomycetales bacterium ZRK34]